MQWNTAEACPNSAGIQHTDITQCTLVCFCICFEAEVWQCLQPQAKHKLLLEEECLGIRLLGEQF